MQCTDGKKSENSFSVRSGVRQGCILSPILFNIALDYIMRQTTQNAHHDIQWTLFSQLEYLDYADDIVLLSTTENHMHKKAQLLTENARKTGLQTNQKKPKVLCMNLKERPQIKIDEEELEVVTDFTYLGSNISVENSVQKDISVRTNKARRICNIFWPNKISNEDLYRRTNSLPISCKIKKHRMRWLGHVLRMSPDLIPRVALTRKRSKGPPT